MKTFSILEADDGRSLIRSTNGGRPPAFRVDIVVGDHRAPCGEYSDIDDANKLADWFGRDGYLRAEVVSMAG